MCTRPIRLFNRSNHFNPYTMNLYNIVPCGQCEECLASAREDWFVRCFFEWQQHPYSTFFYTLTFNPESLPTYNGFLCFDKRGVQLFLKRFRKMLGKLGITFKYIFVSEYGELYKRPHYHALFFLSQTIDPKLFRKLINDAWGQGFCVPGDNYGIVDSSKGVNYVCKYITKDDSFVKLYQKKFIKFLLFKWYRLYRRTVDNPIRPPKGRLFFDFNGVDIKDIPTDVMLYNNFYQSALRDYQQKMPFHLQSTKLGLGCLDKIYTNEQDKVYLLGVGERNIPRYIKRALWYDKRADLDRDGQLNSFVMNDNGRQHLLSVYDSKLAEQMSLINSSVDTFENLEHKEDIDTILNSLPYDIDKESLKCVLQHFFSKDYNLSLLAQYMLVYRNRVFPCTKDIEEIDKMLFVAKRHRFYRYMVYGFRYVDFGQLYKYSELKFEECNILVNGIGRFLQCEDKHKRLIDWLSDELANNHPLFAGCEQIALFIDAVNNFVRSRKAIDRKKKRDAERFLRQRYKIKCLT